MFAVHDSFILMIKNMPDEPLADALEELCGVIEAMTTTIGLIENTPEMAFSHNMLVEYQAAVIKQGDIMAEELLQRVEVRARAEDSSE